MRVKRHEDRGDESQRDPGIVFHDFLSPFPLEELGEGSTVKSEQARTSRSEMDKSTITD